MYYLVSDEKGKLEGIVEKKKKSDDSNIDGILVCSECGSQIGESVLNRGMREERTEKCCGRGEREETGRGEGKANKTIGEGSPKPQLKMTMVKFTNTSNKIAVKFPNANDAYEYFSEAMAVGNFSSTPLSFLLFFFYILLFFFSLFFSLLSLTVH